MAIELLPAASGAASSAPFSSSAIAPVTLLVHSVAAPFPSGSLITVEMQDSSSAWVPFNQWSMSAPRVQVLAADGMFRVTRASDATCGVDRG